MGLAWRLFGAALSALLMVSAFPGNPAPLAVWVCLVPWLLALRSGATRRPGSAARVSLLISFVFSGLVWMAYLWWPFYESAITIAPHQLTAVALTATNSLSYMLPFLILGALHYRFDNDSVFAAVTLASLLTVATFMTPTLFVFNLGSFLYEQPLALQLLDLSGTSLLLWCIVLVNILVRNILIVLWRARLQRPVLLLSTLKHNITALVSLLILVFGYGALNLSQGLSEDRGSLRIASIQPNMSPRVTPRAMIRDSKQGAAYSHLELTRKVLREHKRPDLVVWPENSVEIFCDDPVVQQTISKLASEIEIPIMHQCIDCTSRSENGGCFNQSRYVDEQGNTRFTHNKRKLIPLFEQMLDLPLGSLLANRLRKREPSLVSGAMSPIFEHDKARIIPAICFDAQSPELLRSGLERGGQVLVVQSNDRIFKMSTIGLFDLAINIASAVAMRVPMVKVSNSGYGAFLQSNGRLVPGSITPVLRSMTTVHELSLQPRTSLYRRFGNWFVYLAGVLAVFGWVASSVRGRALVSRVIPG